MSGHTFSRNVLSNRLNVDKKVPKLHVHVILFLNLYEYLPSVNSCVRVSMSKLGCPVNVYSQLQAKNPDS